MILNSKEELLQIIKAGILGRRLLELTYEGDQLRRVEPYVLYEDSGGELFVAVFQLWGHSRSGETSGWKALKLPRITTIRLLEETFTLRGDFNAVDRSNYHRVILGVL